MPEGGCNILTELTEYSEANISQLPPVAARFRGVVNFYNDSAYLSGMSSVALAAGVAKDALKGRYFDVTQDLEDVVSQADAIKADPLLHGLGTKFLGTMNNYHFAKQELEKPVDFPGFDI